MRLTNVFGRVFFVTLLVRLMGSGFTVSASAAEARTNDASALWSRPLSLVEALNLSEAHNAALLQAKQDLESSYGVAIQTRAIALPKVRVASEFRRVDDGTLETIRINQAPPGVSVPRAHDESWNAGIQLVQSIYEGGRVQAAQRSSRLTREQAVLRYQTALLDTLLTVRIAYDDALLFGEQIVVQEASVNLLTKELEDTRRRFDAGVVPHFNVLRAETELGNARPRLIKARNAFRIGKQNLVNLLGFDVPQSVSEDIPIQLSDRLEAVPYELDLKHALDQAISRRTELAASRKAERLQQEALVSAQAGRKPSVQLFAGYGGHSRQFSEDLADPLYGWNVGGQLSWDVFDGLLTKGRVAEARALHDKSIIAVDDSQRRIELEVRTAYSSFIEAKEVLQSQEKVVEQAQEALRLATSRADAGTATQLDVLGAQTALTEARSTRIAALHDYSVARARLERAIGQDVPAAPKP